MRKIGEIQQSLPAAFYNSMVTTVVLSYISYLWLMYDFVCLPQYKMPLFISKRRPTQLTKLTVVHQHKKKTFSEPPLILSSDSLYFIYFSLKKLPSQQTKCKLYVTSYNSK